MVSPHQEFITSSVTDVFREASAALSSIDDGMMMLKASDYILQTAFMKMTGFLEQKMKCICWEIASQSYEYRHGVFFKERICGFSSYREKKAVLNDLIRELRRCNEGFEIDKPKKQEMILRMEDDMDSFYKVPCIPKIYARQCAITKELIKNIKPDDILPGANKGDITKTELFGGQVKGNGQGIITKNGRVDLQYAYEEIVYKHRNRCAHNTICYQRNNPLIDVVSSADFPFHNYLVRFAILDLIDVIFIAVYNNWGKACQHSYAQ